MARGSILCVCPYYKKHRVSLHVALTSRFAFASYHSSDESAPEDLLAKLRDCPHVLDKALLHTGMLPPITPIIYQDGHHLSGRDSPTLPSLVIDTTPETVLPYEEEGDATKDILDASRILRGYVHQNALPMMFNQFPITQASGFGYGTL